MSNSCQDILQKFGTLNLDSGTNPDDPEVGIEIRGLFGRVGSGF